MEISTARVIARFMVDKGKMESSDLMGLLSDAMSQEAARREDVL